MAGRRLSPEEREIWARLARSVTPLPGKAVPQLYPDVPPKVDAAVAAPRAKAPRAVPDRASPRSPPQPRNPSPVLDSTWERRISTGSIIPDMSVDLHGHTLHSAHQRLNQSLAMAVATGARVLLVVTGNPRPAPTGPAGEKARGAIRAEIGDWLALSGHADAIASVRTAHPRHGGKGALYVILRRG
ncbi:MAG TPA: Smr/MutS family protein [Sphingobium sp.]|nr:Smr/MutS family protein [Sphingobium sp.]